MGLHKAERDRDGVRNFFPSCKARMGQDKIMRDKDENPILRPHPAPLPSLPLIPSLFNINSLLSFFSFFSFEVNIWNNLSIPNSSFFSLIKYLYKKLFNRGMRVNFYKQYFLSHHYFLFLSFFSSFQLNRP